MLDFVLFQIIQSRRAFRRARIGNTLIEDFYLVSLVYFCLNTLRSEHMSLLLCGVGASFEVTEHMAPKMAPRWAQDGPRWPPKGPNMAQNGSKMSPRWAQDGPKWGPKGSKMGPEGPQEGSQIVPKSVLEGLPTSKPKKGD